MCSPTIKWNTKSTLFPLTELDEDGLESCCGVLDVGRVSHSDQMITGRGWEHHILMVPRRKGWSLSKGPITWTYTRQFLEQVLILGSTLNVVSLKSYGLGASVPDIPVDGKAQALGGTAYTVGINIGDRL
jgi:hypothetical protein